MIPYWRLSSFYFFYFATVGGFIPYWSLYLKHEGFNAVDIGLLSAISVGVRIIAPNILGWLADYTGKALLIIQISCFLAILSFTGFLINSSYVWFAIISGAFSLFWNASLPQFEAITLFHLKDQAHRYSHIRLWGSIGFIVTALSIGQLLDFQPITLLPYIIIGTLIGMWISSLFTPKKNLIQHQKEHSSITSVLIRKEVILFFIVYIFLQTAHSPYYVFYSLYLKQYHYSVTLTGLLWALGVISEIGLFIYASRLFKTYSIRTILLISISLSILRWALIAHTVQYLPTLIIAQLLHAASFGGTHLSAIHLVHRYFGHTHQGKGQALYSSASFGLGGMLGSLYSGYGWDLFGGQFVFGISAFCCSIALLLAYSGVRDNLITLKPVSQKPIRPQRKSLKKRHRKVR